jgi:hypothetical protein
MELAKQKLTGLMDQLLIDGIFDINHITDNANALYALMRHVDESFAWRLDGLVFELLNQHHIRTHQSRICH